MPEFVKFLAFDTSTDQLSLAVTDGARTWQHTGPGGAQASSTLVPAILALLQTAGLGLDDLDAVVFGRGPGSFTGLRTACAVAQGLAFGARRGVGIPVLPVDTLLALAEEARYRQPAAIASARLVVTALLDARMDEVYQQTFAFGSGGWQPLGPCTLARPEALAPGPLVQLLAGNVFGVYAGRLPAQAQVLPQATALPTAAALLRLAPALAAAGGCVDASQALPRYVRDKVAQTTDERALSKAAAAVAAS